ncbi:MAG: hypothetical protein M1485_03305, partial [Chloroflexi bacterium]|nr:hypothetical protein [Chloroflexota bacterium]
KSEPPFYTVLPAATPICCVLPSAVMATLIWLRPACASWQLDKIGDINRITKRTQRILCVLRAAFSKSMVNSSFCHFFTAKSAKYAKKKEIFVLFAGFAVHSVTLRKP